MKYQLANGPKGNTVQLQGVGHVVGQPAENIKPGDNLMWNFGATAEVQKIIKETQKFIVIKSISESGYVGERRLKKSRLVVILSK